MEEENHATSEKLPLPEIAKRVRAARELGGYRSQARFKQALKDEEGVAAEKVKDLEGARTEIEPWLVKTLAGFLDLPPAWFTKPREAVISAEGPRPSQLDRIEAKLDKLLEQNRGDHV